MDYEQFQDLKTYTARISALFEEIKNVGISLDNHLRHHDALSIALIGIIGVLASTILVLIFNN